MTHRTALVSIGLPVFNGEKYLDLAIESLLEQDYENLELVISDNASTDSTPEILDLWAQRDSRIRLFRNPTNLGGAANFNRVLELARGQYFRWAGHDDLLDRRMISSCVEVLDTAGPDYVLVFPDTMEIDSEGGELGLHVHPLQLHQPTAVARYREVVRRVGKAHIIFGLMRTDVVRSTRGLGRYPSADFVLIGELALRGGFKRVPETLFYRRIHAGASWHATGKHEGFAQWFDPTRPKTIVYPSWRLWREFAWAPFLTTLPISQKVACSATAVIAWVRRRRLRLLGELIRTVSVILSRIRPKAK